MADLDVALDENRGAVREFVRHVQGVPDERWNVPPAPGKWSPGQVVDHVAVSYEMSRAALAGQSAMPGVPRWVRPLIRVLFLNRVMKTGRFPRGAKAPAAFQPAATPAAREAGLARLERASADFEAEARAMAGAGAATIDHPVFGRLQIAAYVRLAAVHTRHHRKQVRP